MKARVRSRFVRSSLTKMAEAKESLEERFLETVRQFALAIVSVLVRASLVKTWLKQSRYDKPI